MPVRGPAEQVLTAAVARRHYLLGQSKTEIADDLGLSRFKVARLIEEARAEGIVRIEIVRQGALDVELSARLQEAFGLQHALVLDCPDGDPAVRRSQLGAAAAGLLAEVLTAADVLGLPWSRAVHAMVEALTELPPVDVVQLTGALVLPELDSSTVDIVRRTARISGGRARVFFAPFVLDDAHGAEMLRRQPAVADALGHVRDVTKALVGVGAWLPGESTIHDLVSPAEQRSIARAGVVGELAGVFFDDAGQPCRPPLAERMITLRDKEIQDIPAVIAVVGGRQKAPAIRAALRGGLISGLVVDDGLAQALLAGS